MFAVGDRVFLRSNPDRVGTVKRVYSYGALTIKDWADVKWDDPIRADQYGDTSSCPVDILEKL